MSIDILLWEPSRIEYKTINTAWRLTKVFNSIPNQYIILGTAITLHV